MATASTKARKKTKSGTKKAPAKKTAPAKKPAAKKASAKKPAAKKKAAKGKVADRSAPPMAEVDADVLEFIAAIDRFKKEHGRPFPSWSEVLLVVRKLGYRRGK